MTRISVVIPTYNKVRFLELTLYALQLQDYDRNHFEVIVVNDGSADGTQEILDQLQVSYECRHIRHEVNQGRSHARNSGLEAAAGEVIVFIDDDCLCTPQFLREHDRHHHQTQQTAVIGYRYEFLTHLPDQDDPFHTIVTSFLRNNRDLKKYLDWPIGQLFIDKNDLKFGLQTITNLSYKGERSRWAEVYDRFGPSVENFVLPWMLVATSNFSATRESLLSIGGFDPNIRGWGYEDSELGYRLYRSGVQFVLDKQASNYRAHHYRDVGDQISSMIANYRYCCEKHQAVEMFLHWRVSLKKMSILDLNELIAEYYKLPSGSRIRTEYARLAQNECFQFGYDRRMREGSLPPHYSQPQR